MYYVYSFPSVESSWRQLGTADHPGQCKTTAAPGHTAARVEHLDDQLSYGTAARSGIIQQPGPAVVQAAGLALSTTIHTALISYHSEHTQYTTQSMRSHHQGRAGTTRRPLSPWKRERETERERERERTVKGDLGVSVSVAAEPVAEISSGGCVWLCS